MFYQKFRLTKRDIIIPQHLTGDFLKFQNTFNKINQFSFSICITFSSGTTFELHGFSNVSMLTSAAAINFRQNQTVKTNVFLFVSKTNVAPVKQIYVLKFEL